MSVYLHEIDIDEEGREMSLPAPIDEFVLKYALLFDHVTLQASSVFKRRDAFDFFDKHNDLFVEFTFNNKEKFPLISLILSKDINSYEQYISQRYEILSKSPFISIDPEWLSYNDNHSLAKSKIVDKIISKKEIKHRMNSVDVIFRNKSLSYANLLSSKFPDVNVHKLKSLIEDTALKSELFQTFSIMSELKSRKYNYKISFINHIGHELRSVYFSSNAEGASAIYRENDWHYAYNNVNLFFSLTGMERIFQHHWQIDRNIIELIKNLKSFQALRDSYFAIKEQIVFINLFDACEKAKKSLIVLPFLYKADYPYWYYDLAWTMRQANYLRRELDSVKLNVKYHHEFNIMR